MNNDNNDMPDLINFLKQNGYRFDGTNQIRATSIATFSKDAGITELNGDYVNDANINITINFDPRFDYNNATINDGEVIYDPPDPQSFMNRLWNVGNGVKRKGRKTKKNNKKNKRR